LPVTPLRLLLGLVEWGFRSLKKRPPVGRFTLDKLLEDVAISGQKIEQALGFQPQFDLRRGWATTIEQMIADETLSTDVTHSPPPTSSPTVERGQG